MLCSWNDEPWDGMMEWGFKINTRSQPFDVIFSGGVVPVAPFFTSEDWPFDHHDQKLGSAVFDGEAFTLLWVTSPGVFEISRDLKLIEPYP